VIDIANATLAGGVAIGSVCDHATNQTALMIGIVAGILSVVGFAVIQPKLEEVLQKKDTCGVMYLHGLPGLFGGLSAMFVVSGMNVMAQIIGIFASLAIALIAGFVSGKILAIPGRRIEPYMDEEELIEADS
jgi:ammonium transporter Rh